jgi:outer membrane protein assembly factor BamA
MNSVSYFRILFLIFFCAGSLHSALPDINIEEKTIEITPKLQITLPNVAIDIFLNERISRTLIDFGLKYDFLDNHIDGMLDLRYHYPVLFLGIKFQDNIDFEEVFAEQNCIQRSRYILLYSGWKISNYAEFKTSIKSENTFTVIVDSSVEFDKGRNFPGILTLLYDTLEETDILPKGTKISLDLTGSLGILGGDYEYSQVEFNLIKYLYPAGSNYFKTNLKIGYPVSTVKKPWSALYYLGGYELLRGYNHKELRGDSLIYMQVSYHIPLVTQLGEGDTSLEIITGDFICEFGKTGEKDIFDNSDDFKTSIGIGFSCTLTFLKNINTKFNVFLGQALESRSPAVYFTLKAFNYIREK